MDLLFTVIKLVHHFDLKRLQAFAVVNNAEQSLRVRSLAFKAEQHKLLKTFSIFGTLLGKQSSEHLKELIRDFLAAVHVKDFNLCDFFATEACLHQGPPVVLTPWQGHNHRIVHIRAL